ncbi:hypothetical protein HEP87_64570 [Streptomyces sp. S1D4-11]
MAFTLPLSAACGLGLGLGVRGRGLRLGLGAGAAASTHFLIRPVTRCRWTSTSSVVFNGMGRTRRSNTGRWRRSRLVTFIALQPAGAVVETPRCFHEGRQRVHGPPAQRGAPKTTR